MKYKVLYTVMSVEELHDMFRKMRDVVGENNKASAIRRFGIEVNEGNGSKEYCSR
jgi:hypothetical protein